MKAFIGAAAVVAAADASSTLKLTWTDCGDSSTHTKITSFSPDSLTTGQKTTMTGTGNLDEDVTAATFDLEMKTSINTVSCKGDASQSKTCSLPLGVGSLTFDPLTFPIKKGSTSISVDIQLSSLLPASLANTNTTVTATTSSGDKLFCMDIISAPSEDISEQATCSGSGDPAGDACYEGSAGVASLKETVKVDLEKYASGAGTMKLTGTGITAFTCGDHAFTKSGQDIKADLSDCLPDGITLETVKYCSDDDTVSVTVKDKTVPLPISATLKKVTCGANTVVV